MRRAINLSAALVAALILAACSQVTPTPATSLQGLGATQMPLPSFSSSFSGNTRGLWFEAPVAFRITGLRVPDEAGRGSQNVEVFKLEGPPPAFSASATGGQVFYRTGVPSGDIIATQLQFAQGDYVGILGATSNDGGASSSYGAAEFNSNILGEAVVLKRLLTQTSLATSGGNQPYSTEAGGSIGRVEIYVTTPDTTNPTITLATPANGATYQQGESVTVNYSCADEEEGAGIESCTGTSENSSTLDTSTPGTYSFKVDAEDNVGNTSSVTNSYTVEAAPEPTAESYLIDFEKAPANRLLYSVKTGQGVVYEGEGTARNSTVPIVGKRRLDGKILEGHTAKVMSLHGSKRLTISSGSVNAPATQGGRLKLTFSNFDPKGVTLTSLTLTNLTAKGAYLTFYYVNGSSSRQTLGTTAPGASLVVPLTIEGLRAVDIYAPSAYSVDDVTFKIPAPVVIDPCRSAIARC